MKGYLALIRKDFSTHMHGLAVYVKEGLPFAQVLSLENSADTYFTQCLTCFSFIDQHLSLCAVFYSISSTIDQVLSINPFDNVFVFGDFNVHHKDWHTYSGGTGRSGELCYNLKRP